MLPDLYIPAHAETIDSKLPSPPISPAEISQGDPGALGLPIRFCY